MLCSDCGKELKGTPSVEVENGRIIRLCDKCKESYDLYGVFRHKVRRAESGHKGGTLLDK